jgi:hypothetical protein
MTDSIIFGNFIDMHFNLSSLWLAPLAWEQVTLCLLGELLMYA